MKIALVIDGNHVGGAGEGKEIVIVDSEKNYEIVERFDNPALTAESSRGIVMLSTVYKKGVTSIIVGHIGPHAFTFTKNRMTVYDGNGLTLKQAIESFKNNMLPEITKDIAARMHEHHH